MAKRLSRAVSHQTMARAQFQWDIPLVRLTNSWLARAVWIGVRPCGRPEPGRTRPHTSRGGGVFESQPVLASPAEARSRPHESVGSVATVQSVASRAFWCKPSGHRPATKRTNFRCQKEFALFLRVAHLTPHPTSRSAQAGPSIAPFLRGFWVGFCFRTSGWGSCVVSVCARRSACLARKPSVPCIPPFPGAPAPPRSPRFLLRQQLFAFKASGAQCIPVPLGKPVLGMLLPAAFVLASRLVPS